MFAETKKAHDSLYRGIRLMSGYQSARYKNNLEEWSERSRSFLTVGPSLRMALQEGPSTSVPVTPFRRLGSRVLDL